MHTRCPTPLRRSARPRRGIVTRTTDGHWQVAITGNEGSGILCSRSEAVGLVVLHPDQGDVPARGAPQTSLAKDAG
jgi:molybdopterin molybdotransferase